MSENKVEISLDVAQKALSMCYSRGGCKHMGPAANFAAQGLWDAIEDYELRIRAAGEQSAAPDPAEDEQTRRFGYPPNWNGKEELD